MKIIKFGGSSVADANAITKVKEILLTRRDEKLLVIFSAFKGITNALIESGEMAASGKVEYKDVCQRIRDKHMEVVMGLISSANQDSVQADVNLMLSEFEQLTYGVYLLRELSLKTKDFIGTTDDGIISTLGRGGSDLSAAIFANALNAEAMEKWTDVSGMMTADPRIVKNASIIRSLSYEEAMELCHFGAKVIYPPTIHPLLEKNIPIIIKNTFAPEDKGTRIGNHDEEVKSAVIGLSSISDIALVTLSGSGMVGIPGFSRRMFTTLSYNRININLITQASSEHSITIGIERNDIEQAKACLEEEFAYDIEIGKINSILIEEDLSIIALVGDNMKLQTGIAGKSLYTLGKNGVNIRAIAQGSSEKNISLVIADKDVTKSLRTLHEALFESGLVRLNLFMVGKGNVGGTLIDQIKLQKQDLLYDHNVEVRVVAIAGSKKMIFDEAGIPLENWKEDIKNGEDMSLDLFHQKMVDLNLRNSVFVDNTAEVSVSDFYEKVLENSISVVTSNKIAASSPYSRFSKLKALAKKRHVRFMNETNVGAGLPVIDTIQNLVKSGDKVKEIHAILSGSLTFIFNEFNADTKFVDIVKQAMKEGFTEPDPRIDLSGVDVARKILILARESGIPLEMDQIENKKFLPSEILDNGDVDSFLSGLVDFESEMQSKLKTASDNGEKLKYIAYLVDGKASVSLGSVDEKHAFYRIEGADNIIMIYTKRYGNQPLVIKGAGAGAEVTAMGVFSDIIRLAQD